MPDPRHARRRWPDPACCRLHPPREGAAPPHADGEGCAVAHERSMELAAGQIHLVPASGTSESELCRRHLEMQLHLRGRESGPVALTFNTTTTASTPPEVVAPKALPSYFSVASVSTRSPSQGGEREQKSKRQEERHPRRRKRKKLRRREIAKPRSPPVQNLGNLTMKWRKVLKEMSALQTAGRFFRRHPLVLWSLFFLIILYKYFFSWFTLLVATSPIFLFTGFFLGIILAYGESNSPENDHIYKKIVKAQSRNIHDNGKSVVGVSLPRIPSIDERVAKHNNSEKKIRKRYHAGGSSSESGSGESDGSETDTLPMLHAFHQLRSAASSPRSSQDGDSNASSIEDGTENQEGNVDNEREDKEDVRVVAWTADDQKNILKIGCLEIERNQRLESLIARRRARKYTDRNLIDFGSSESLPTIEELSKFNVQIPTVFAPRKNPFDLPYNEDNFPDSAPSAPLKVRNTFDLPHEQANESSSTGGANSSHVEPIPVASQPQWNTMFRRHESFTEGAPFLSDFWQDLQPSRFRPYFVTEKMVNEGLTVPSLEGETSEKSSVQDSDSTSSVTDQESQKEVLEDSSNHGHGPPFSQTDEQPPSAQNVREVPLALDIEPPVLISDSSDDDISLPGGHINDWEEAQDSENLNLSHNMPLEDPSVMEYPQEMEMKSNEFHQISPHSNDLDSISSSTEATEPSEVNNIELPGKKVEIIDDTEIAEPVYDSSPSGSEKPTSIGSAIDEALLQEDNARTSDAEASIEEDGSLSRIEATSSEIAAPSLSSVEESELREKRASEIREDGIVGHDGAHEDSVSHADPAVSDIISQPTTSSSTNGKSGGRIISSSKKAVFGFFKK